MTEAESVLFQIAAVLIPIGFTVLIGLIAFVANRFTTQLDQISADHKEGMSKFMAFADDMRKRVIRLEAFREMEMQQDRRKRNNLDPDSGRPPAR